MEAAELRDELESLGASGFGEAHGRFFLVVTDRAQLEDMALFVNTASRSAHDVATARHIEHAAFLPITDGKASQQHFTVGRDAGCDVVLAHRGVSKVQARFSLVGGLLSLSDAGSKNGTRLNGMLLSPEQLLPVDLGDTVEFGPVTTTIWGIDDIVAALGSRGG
jgi:hypothetical protein